MHSFPKNSCDIIYVIRDNSARHQFHLFPPLQFQAGKDAAALKSESHMLPKQTLEINPSHPIIVRLNAARSTDPEMSRAVAEQVYVIYISSGLSS